ncbi:hypothetical protein [Nocardia abscessus]|uniref:hypothetical protein n=1 Tax=Nocardia abscessus TaxID=120957 RepID=UPI0024553080|nr:hypothetical protein [Nocardia abscessus]
MIPAQGTLDASAVARATTAQQNAAAAQARVSTGDAELDDLGAGTDPSFVQTIEHFEGMTHEQMYEAVHGPGGMDAAGLRTLQRTWFESYSDLVNLSTFNSMGLARIFGNGLWEGASGTAAQAASNRLSAAANQIGRVFDSVANRLDALAWSAEAVRAAVQPPPAAAPPLNPDNQVESILPGLINPEYDDQTRAAQEQARQAVIRALNSAYTPVFPPAGTDVPAYTSVPQIGGTDGPPATTTSPEIPSHGPGDTAGPNSGTPQQVPNAPIPTEDEPSGIESPTMPSGLGIPEGLLPGIGQDTTPSSATTPAGVSAAPTSPTSPGLSPNGPGPGPGSPSTPGLGAPGTLGSGPSAPNSPLPGSAPTSTTTNTSTGRGGTRTPMGPMGGPAAGTRGKKDDDENIHQSPDYLRQVYADWTEGLDSPAGVIGADLTDFDREPTTTRAQFTNAAPAYTEPPATWTHPGDRSGAGYPDLRPGSRTDVPITPQQSPTATAAGTSEVVAASRSNPAFTPPIDMPRGTASQSPAPSGGTEPTTGGAESPGHANTPSTFASASIESADNDLEAGGGSGDEPQPVPVEERDPQIDANSDGGEARAQVVTITGAGPFMGGEPGSSDDLTIRITAATSTGPNPEDDIGGASR